MTGPAYRMFPSIERFLVANLAEAVGVHVLTELPNDFQNVDGPIDLLPVIAVDRIAGSDLDPKMDRPIVDIDAYASNRADAEDLARRIHFYVRFELPGERIPFEGTGLVVTRSRTVVGPRLLPHANPGVRRYVSTYEFVLHPTP